MKRFVHHNPIHGLEHLPFDQAVRRRREHLLGGNGYLSNAEYRRLPPGRPDRRGDSVTAALRRVGPRRRRADARSSPGARRIDAAEVWRAHLLFGFEPLEPMLLAWTLGAGGALRRSASRPSRRVRDGCSMLAWKSPIGSGRRRSLRARPLGGVPARDLARRRSGECRRAASGARPGRPTGVALPPTRTVGDWLETLAGESIVEPINGQMTKWVAAFVDEGMAGWAMPGGEHGFYQTPGARWRRGICPGRFLGIRDFAAEGPRPARLRRRTPSHCRCSGSACPRTRWHGVPVPAPGAVAGLGRPDPLAR